MILAAIIAIDRVAVPDPCAEARRACNENAGACDEAPAP